MKVLALDPGGSTGLAVLDCDDFPIQYMYELESWQLIQNNHHKFLWETLDQMKPDLIVCESFQYRNGLDKANLIPVEYIGLARLWCQLHGKKLVLQSPAQAKALWTDDKLKSTGLYKAAKPHANDAMRHLLYYVTVTKTDYYFIKQLSKTLDRLQR